MVKIALYSTKQNTRIEKIVTALRKTNKFYITLVCNEYQYGDKNFVKLFDEIKIVSFYDKLIHFSRAISGKNRFVKYIRGRLYNRRTENVYKKNLHKTLNELEEQEYKLIYLFDHDRSVNFIKYIIQNTSLKTVFDSYDLSVVREAYSRVTKEDNLNDKDYNVEDERYCLEFSDGICSRFDLYLFSHMNSLGYKVQKRQLYFTDYCNDNCFQPINYHRKFDKIKRIAYVGILPTNEFNFYDDIEKIDMKKIKFYMYSQNFMWFTKKELSYYYDLEQKSILDIKGYIKSSNVPKEISQYDFGLANHINGKCALLSEVFNKYSIGNKIFTYLEAGLPIITLKDMEGYSDLVNKYKIGVVLDYENRVQLPDVLEMSQLDYEMLLKNVEKVRSKELSLFQNAHRLEEFLLSIIDNRG